MNIEELEVELLSLSSADKVRLLQLLFSDLTGARPGIEKMPDALGGDAWIARTQIPVWALEGYRRIDWSDAKILENYPGLTAIDLAFAWAYVAANRDEIETALRDNGGDAGS